MSKIKELISTNNIIKYCLILVLVIIILLGTTLAYYSWGSTEENNTNISFDVIADSVYIYYDGGSDITGVDLYPTDNKSDGIKKDITVSVDKNSSSAKFNLYLDINTLPDALKESSFKYALYQDSTVKTSGSFNNINSISCSTNNTSHIVLLSDVTPSTTKVTYTLYIWIDGTETNPDSMMNQSFSFTLHADGVNVKEPTYLYNQIKSNAVMDNVSSTYVTSSSGISFSSISSDTNGKGVYELSSTKDDEYPIYYYRGAVTDNNVLFANFCWKIVRTTETGGVKLIYNGTPSSGQCTNTTGTSTQIGASAFNSTNTSPTYVGYMYGTAYTYNSKTMSSITDSYYYGNSVSYSSGTYTLSTTTSDAWSNLYNGGLNSYHYTCFSTDTTCSTVYYIYYTNSSTAYYIELTGGKTVEDALSEMLDYNTNSSKFKGSSTTSGSIDYWYYNNLLDYTDKLEDTVWCNDRSIYQKNGWESNGGSTRLYLYFGAYGRLGAKKSPSLTCERDIDKFTVSSDNGNGDLDYPVGLLTADEIAYAGGVFGSYNSTYYLYTGSYWWSLSPYYFTGSYAGVWLVYSDGGLYANGVFNSRGVRPAVSLKPGTTYSSGDGTLNSPYIVL